MTESTRGRSSLLRASALMASGTMVSRILGFVRSAMLLAALGSAGGGVSAAFQTANTLPNTVFNLLASGILDAVLVPQIVMALKRKHDGQAYVNKLLTLAGTLLFGVTLITMVAAPLLVIITAAGYDAEIRGLAIAFALLCLPQLFFYGVYNLLGELLNARGVFGPYMWAPVVNNIVGIAGLGLFLGLWGRAEGRIEIADFSSAQFWVLAGSATLGVIAQALILVVPMRRAKISFKPDFHFKGTSFGSVSKVAGWTFATLGVSQVGVLSTNNLSALADAAAKADNLVIAGILGYSTAFMIFMVPQSLITVSLTTAIFTRMAESVADEDDAGVASSYHLGVRTITSLTLPAAAILMAASVPMMQMAIPTETNQTIVVAYAWILTALMPGVASTGMVLMSQRVFFAYEDVKPVFLMGIGPTILQVIVGWGMYALTDSAWWVVGAALGETVCRLTQGVIAVVWVARRNPLVDQGKLLHSYVLYFVAAVVAGTVGFGVLWLVGIQTVFTSTLVRFAVATVKVMCVAMVVALVYMMVLRVIGREESAQTIAPLLARLRVPNRLRSVLAASPAAIASRSVIMDEDAPAGAPADETEDQMDRKDELNAADGFEPLEDALPEASDATRSGFDQPESDIDQSVAADPESFDSGNDSGDGDATSRHIPSFDDIIADPKPVVADAAAVAEPKASWLAAAGAAVSGWAAKLRSSTDNASNSDAEAQELSSDLADEATHAVDEPADMPPAPPADHGDENRDETGNDEPNEAAETILDNDLDATMVRDPGFAAAMAVGGEAVNTPVTSIPQIDNSAHASNTAPDWDAVMADGSSSEGEGRSTSSVLPSSSNGSGPMDAQGRRLIDPAKPTLIFASALVVIGAVFATFTLMSPVTDLDIAESLMAAQSGKGQSEGGQSEADSAPPTVAPVISSVSVLSWNNDGGDHEDMAVRMIDGDPATEWRSRWYDVNQFLDETNITIVVRLKEQATVSTVTLQMDPTTSGGELVVRNVTDPGNPRGGTELTSSALSPTTTITLPEPVTTDQLALSFRTLPTSVDGNNWAWVYELGVQ
ncbi:murein biosynthesis integral membrane protein MurJ [Schaalia vaccimaxillae]|uniref:murein biosynthesis integral membrane protein MurJ n=1 Tax=Schaalia vaccimaxillae TaxID=183916 RepID=UPI0003B6B632|nr:murein biosynthesis integral membrane protein MurJ [Schaalia vaccimaxillae]